MHLRKDHALHGAADRKEGVAPAPEQKVHRDEGADGIEARVYNSSGHWKCDCELAWPPDQLEYDQERLWEVHCARGWESIVSDRDTGPRSNGEQQAGAVTEDSSNAQESPSQREEQKQETEEPSIGSILSTLRGSEDKDAVQKACEGYMRHLVAEHKMDGYKILILFDEEDSIIRWHSDRIYQAATRGDTDKPILLVLHSPGGSIEPAYLISKTCQRMSNGQFIVCVPRQAKSAATLLSLGANEIHMGLMSELGPIDPQIGGLPALGMQNALRMLAAIACEHPGSAEMFARLLSEKIDLQKLGYFERVGESAVQYAERLLDGRELPDGSSPRGVADHLVNHYKDHGFVIDADEALGLLGKVIKVQTKEYAFANEVYEALNFFKIAFRMLRSWTFDYVRAAGGGMRIVEISD